MHYSRTTSPITFANKVSCFMQMLGISLSMVLVLTACAESTSSSVVGPSNTQVPASPTSLATVNVTPGSTLSCGSFGVVIRFLVEPIGPTPNDEPATVTITGTTARMVTGNKSLSMLNDQTFTGGTVTRVSGFTFKVGIQADYFPSGGPPLRFSWGGTITAASQCTGSGTWQLTKQIRSQLLYQGPWQTT